MRPSKTLLAGILLASCVSPALAQTNVGQLLDGGATKLSAADFKAQIVGRYLEGPGRGAGYSASFVQEVVYVENGLVRGSGRNFMTGEMAVGGTFAIDGTWTIDDRDRVCQTTRAGSVVLAPRCQYWFKLSDKYFFADSDSDRSAFVTVRTVKKP